MTEGVLKKITYPTGGYTEFEFETNKYSEGGESKYAGGLRVKKITTRASANDSSLTKTYKYGFNGDGFGFKNFNTNLGFFVSANREIVKWEACFDCDANYYTVRNYNSTSSMQIDGSDGSPVLYPYVSEYSGTESNNNGRIEYVYDQGAPESDNIALIYGPGTSSFQRQSNSWKRGNLSKKTIYTASSHRVSRTTNTYGILHPIYATVGLLIQENDHLLCTLGGTCAQFLGANPYLYNYYSVNSGVTKLASTTDSLYDQVDSSKFIVNNISYLYDTIHLQPVEISKQTGLAEQIVNYTKYPFNYTFTSAPSGGDAEGIKYLQDKNIYDAPIEQYTAKKYTGGSPVTKVIGGIINTYVQGTPNPKKIWQIETGVPLTTASFGTGSSLISNAFTKHSTYQPKLTIQYDAYGNISEYYKENDLKNAFIWNYRHSNVVAEVINADTGSIAYTSFEADGKGGWVFSGASTAHPTEATGIKGYGLAGGNITKSGLSSGTSYIITYWKKDSTSTATVNSGSGSLLVTRNGWKLYGHEITGTTTLTISGTAYIDELRLYPKNAVMTTYTYRPLIGVSSQCDANNRIVYYQYDNFNRLYLIRDQDRNIIKQVCYNYPRSS
jgi:hypothetical protein